MMKMNHSFYFHLLRDEDGILTFEWVLLITLFVIGIVGGLAALRDATNVQYAQAAQAISAANPNYTIGAYTSRSSRFTATGSSYESSSVEVNVRTYPGSGS